MGRIFLFLVLAIPLYSQIQETVIPDQHYIVSDTLVLTDQSSSKRILLLNVYWPWVL